MNRIILYLKNYDWILFFSVLLLISFGLVEIYSIALASGGNDLANFYKQFTFAGIGLMILFVVSFFDYNNYNSFNNFLYFSGFLLLLGVLFFGKTVRGTQGWYDFLGFSLQPVEFAKIVLIIFLSKYFSVSNALVKPMTTLVGSGVGTGVLVFLVMMQPDFGSALLLIAVWGMFLLFSGIKKQYLLILLLIGFVIFSSGWLFFFKDYQKQRLLTFVKPTENSLEEGYNIEQAIIAIGAGGLSGRGVGFGSQSQLKFLPEAQNDFIFAVIAEELGFLGVCLILAFFLVFFLRIFKIARNSNNSFGTFFLLGMGGLIFIEMFINIGMNVGLLPVVGISLPFLSYGGSAVIASLILVGIAENINIQSKLK